MVLTRSQYNLALVEVAANTPPRDTQELNSIQELISFAEMARVRPEHGTTVNILTISLSLSPLEEPLFHKVLRACLNATPNVAILEVFTIPPVAVASLSRVCLPRIEALNTNLPHNVLLSFINKHPSLRALEVNACGRKRRCALSAAAVDHLTEVRCPAECAQVLVHNDLSRLRLDLTRPTTIASAVISRFPIALNALYVLTIEFTVDDKFILRTIAANMPWVRKLRLVEMCQPAVPKTTVRPWAKSATWSLNLKKLYDLEYLVIRTAGMLVAPSSPQGQQQERQVFQRWTGVSVSNPHSTLRYIGVWQSASEDNGGRLSEWSREDGIWSGKWTDAPEVGQLINFK